MSMMTEGATTTEKPFGTSTGTSLPLSKPRAHVRHERNSQGYMPVCPGTGGSEKERHSSARHAIAASPTAHSNKRQSLQNNKRSRSTSDLPAGRWVTADSPIADQLNKAQIPRAVWYGWSIDPLCCKRNSYCGLRLVVRPCSGVYISLCFWPETATSIMTTTATA